MTAKSLERENKRRLKTGRLLYLSQIDLWHLVTVFSISTGWYRIPRSIMVSSSGPTTNKASCRAVESKWNKLTTSKRNGFGDGGGGKEGRGGWKEERGRGTVGRGEEKWGGKGRGEIKDAEHKMGNEGEGRRIERESLSERCSPTFKSTEHCTNNNSSFQH